MSALFCPGVSSFVLSLIHFFLSKPCLHLLLGFNSVYNWRTAHLIGLEGDLYSWRRGRTLFLAFEPSVSSGPAAPRFPRAARAILSTLVVDSSICCSLIAGLFALSTHLGVNPISGVHQRRFAGAATRTRSTQAARPATWRPWHCPACITLVGFSW